MLTKKSVPLTIAAVTAVFLCVSLLSMPVPGVNEPHYLCKARSFADPEWCSRDFFLQSGNAHAVFFAATGRLTGVLPFAAVAVIGRLLSYGLLAVGWTIVAGRFALNGRQTVLAAAVFAGIGQTGNFSGEWTIGGFESKVPAYGFALIATALWTKRQHDSSAAKAVLPGAMLGLSTALHPVVGGWFAIAIAMSECTRLLMRKRMASGAQSSFEGRPVNTAVLLSAAALTALPGLIPAVAMLMPGTQTTADKQTADFIQVFWRLAHHLDPTTFPLKAWIHTAVLSALVLVSLRMQQRPASGSSTEDATDNMASAALARHHWLSMLLMAAIIAVVGIAVGWHNVPAKELDHWHVRAFLLKFYPFRLFDALLPMTVGLLAAGVVANRCSRASTVAAVLACLMACGLAFGRRPEAPAGYSAQQFAAWQNACQWIQDNTHKDALVLTPRESFGFKWYAERAEFVCFKDCPQDSAGIVEWNRRLWAIHGWSESSYRDGDFDVADLRRLHDETGVTHLLTRKLGPIRLQPRYNDGTWRVYEVPSAE